VISGDSNGYYKPKDSLNRAALAKIIAVSIDVLNEEVSVAKSVEAVVKVKLDDTKKIVFYEVADKTKSYIETIDSSVEIKIDGLVSTYSDLALDAIVKLTYNNGKLVTVTSEKTNIEVVTKTGLVGEKLDFNGTKSIFVNLDDGTSTYFNFTENTSITTDGVAGTFEGIKKGDFVRMDLTDKKIVSLDYKVKFQSFSGVIKNIIVEETPKLQITINGLDKIFDVDEKTIVKRNNVIRTIGSLMTGDEVTFDTTFDLITSLTATGVVAKDTGTISKVAIADKNELTVKNAEGLETTYEVDPKAVVRIDGVIANFFDLRTNYVVELRVESSVIKEVIASSKVLREQVVGTIIKVYQDLSVATVSVNDVTYTVYITNTTLKLGTNGEKIAFSSLKAGEKIFVYGVVEDYIIQAEKVFKFE
jgi:hypothetical protein